MSNELVNQALGEFGRQIGLDDLRLDDSGCAALAFDDVMVNLELDEEGERLLLSAYLGEPQGDPLATYALLLDANFCWQGTGGATLALERETGGIVLFQTLPTPTLDRVALEMMLETFVNTADSWASHLAQASAPLPDQPVHTGDELIIRG